jgi:PAS domain S-box-containing protein
MVLTDIDDRKRAEDALRASEQDFRLIVDTIPGLVWTMTASGEVELVNQRMLGYFGKTLEELKEWTLFLHPDDRARVMAYWRGTTESGQAYDLEHRLRRADGAYRWFQARGLPQRDAQGRIVRWYNLLTDIDERKKAEEELHRSRAYLTEAQRLSLTGSFGCTPFPDVQDQDQVDPRNTRVISNHHIAGICIVPWSTPGLVAALVCQQ